jgi:hypothetical protein
MCYNESQRRKVWYMTAFNKIRGFLRCCMQTIRMAAVVGFLCLAASSAQAATDNWAKENQGPFGRVR